LGEKFRGADPARCVTCALLGGPDYLFEIEITADKGVSQLPIKNLAISL